MSFEDCLVAALETVLAWELPEEACPYALTTQAGLMARRDPEQIGGTDED